MTAADTIASLRGACARYEAALRRRQETLDAIDALTDEHPARPIRATYFDRGYSVGYAEAMRQVKALLHPEDGDPKPCPTCLGIGMLRFTSDTGWTEPCPDCHPEDGGQ